MYDQRYILNSKENVFITKDFKVTKIQKPLNYILLKLPAKGIEEKSAKNPTIRPFEYQCFELPLHRHTSYNFQRILKLISKGIQSSIPRQFST